MGDAKRAKKIISRIYEAITYLEILGEDKDITSLRKKIYLYSESVPSLADSKKLFNTVKAIYERKIKERRGK